MVKLGQICSSQENSGKDKENIHLKLFNTVFIICCAVIFLFIITWDIPINTDPIRIIAGTSIEPPRTDWGYTAQYCSVNVCNI